MVNVTAPNGLQLAIGKIFLSCGKSQALNNDNEIGIVFTLLIMCLFEIFKLLVVANVCDFVGSG